MPELVTVELDPALAPGEPDQEIQDLLRASAGLNLGVDFLPGALDFDAAPFAVDPALAGQVLWFDALIGNVDRSWRNPNLLFWHGELYLIDHGATLTFQHNWSGAGGRREPALRRRDHALIGCGPGRRGRRGAGRPLVTAELLRAAVGATSRTEWLGDRARPGHDAERPQRLRRRWTARRPAWLPAAARRWPPEPARTRPGPARPGRRTGP